ncbi:FHA domain-containing protein [Colwellia sp. MEBiC06753]
MAFLIPIDKSNNDQSACYLNHHHVFGRLMLNVDTEISASEISRVHAIIEWLNDEWLIKDLSTNGTWLNQTKLEKNKQYKLRVGDKIFFAKQNTHGYEVKDLAAPENILILSEQNRFNECAHIVLTENNILPSQDDGELSLFYVPSKGQWYQEHLDDEFGQVFPVNHLDYVTFSQQKWQLRLAQSEETTVKVAKPLLKRSELQFRFELSQDEENAKLYIETPYEEYYLSDNTHHYLTLHLARIKAQHAKQGYNEQTQGWVSRELLTQTLGYDMNHLNILICRAKAQFVKTLEGACIAEDLIEREGKNIRFSGIFYSIYKGGNLEVNQGKANLSIAVSNG